MRGQNEVRHGMPSLVSAAGRGSICTCSEEGDFDAAKHEGNRRAKPLDFYQGSAFVQHLLKRPRLGMP